MIARGKLVILLIFILSATAAGFAWFYRVSHGRRALEFLGSESAMLIRDASRISLLRISVDETEGPASDVLQLDSQPYSVVGRVEIGEAPGILNARQALIEDASYDWDRPRGDCQPRWEYVLEFASGPKITALAIDFHCSRARVVGRPREVCIDPMVEGLRLFIREQFERENASARSSDATEHRTEAPSGC